MPPFRRDRFTWLAYLLLAYFSYLQASLGPIMPFVRREFGLSYTGGGLHLSAFALGMIAGGLTGAALAARWGRRVLLWGGAIGMGAGALLLTVGQHPAVTVTATLVMGFLGTFLLVMIQATLSDHHGARRATALTESNILAMLCATLAPILIGLSAQTPLGWRGAVYVGVAAGAVIAALTWRTPIPPRQSRPAQQKPGRLPGAFWAYWFVLLLAVSMEWSLVGWSADFLAGVVGIEVAVAAMLVSVFFVGAVLGRIATSRWTRHTPARTLLVAMLLVVAAGFPLLWLARIPLLNVVGLGTAGFGVGALFPLGLAMALTVAADEADRASARVTIAVGLAVLLAPFTLGWLADTVNMRSAFAVVAVLDVAAIAVALTTNRLLARRAA